MQPDKLNNFFASTAERTIGINAHHVDDYASIINLIQSLPANVDNGFQIRTVTLKEVIHELRNIRSDCSTGPDNIPANMIKMKMMIILERRLVGAKAIKLGPRVSCSSVVEHPN